ncbi:MAG: maleylpyruvate isomerase N-terminal domain-containing protein [Nocardiopsaceae bacterium]|jgi:uncharacterized protein (TIGR03083 family)|nr:maleylpyruvate isomerase N-terminal domain-containing protein [Nocardiopsaceae bacterium]
MQAEPSLPGVVASLRNSHDRLVSVLAALTGDQASGPSYADEWTIAQVASHLGSGAEIYAWLLPAGLEQGDAPGMEQIQPIWDSWNAKPPVQQVGDAVAADAALLDQVDALPPADRQRWRLELFGAEQSLTGLMRMRLSEHAVHTWDIAVALDPAAGVAADAIALLVDTLPGLAGWTGKGAPEPTSFRIVTSDPEREFLLELTGTGARLGPQGTAGTAGAAAVLQLPAEALVRLIYGRLDPDHTPATVKAGDADLDLLRRSFPGF